MKTAEEWVLDWRKRVTDNPEKFTEMLTEDFPRIEIEFYEQIQKDARNTALDETAAVCTKISYDNGGLAGRLRTAILALKQTKG